MSNEDLSRRELNRLVQQEMDRSPRSLREKITVIKASHFTNPFYTYFAAGLLELMRLGGSSTNWIPTSANSPLDQLQVDFIAVDRSYDIRLIQATSGGKNGGRRRKHILQTYHEPLGVVQLRTRGRHIVTVVEGLRRMRWAIDNAEPMGTRPKR